MNQRSWHLAEEVAEKSSSSVERESMQALLEQAPAPVGAPLA